MYNTLFLLTSITDIQTKLNFCLAEYTADEGLFLAQPGDI